MRITYVIWRREFVDKIRRKHDVTEDEVEEVFAKHPPVRRIERGHVEGEDLYRAIGQTDAGRYLLIIFIYKGQGRAMVVSARDAESKEIRSHGKRKK